HFPVMVGMHTLLLVACIAEVALLHRPFIPWLGWAVGGGAVMTTGMRGGWCGAQHGDAVVVCRGARKALESAAHRHTGRSPGASRTVSLPSSPQLHGGDRGSGRAAPCAFGMADGDRLHHRERNGAERTDPHRERRARLRVTGRHRGLGVQPSSDLALAFDSGSQVSPNAIAP